MVALVLAVAAGFPVGREGPMLCLGGCIGLSVCRMLAAPYTKAWVKVKKASGFVTAKFVMEKQLSYVLRMSFVLGGAAGIATAFRAPVGAILYLFEEVTVSSWSLEFTLRAFVCTVLASIVSSFLLDVTGFNINRLLIYNGALHTFQAIKSSVTHWARPGFTSILLDLSSCHIMSCKDFERARALLFDPSDRGQDLSHPKRT